MSATVFFLEKKDQDILIIFLAMLKVYFPCSFSTEGKPALIDFRIRVLLVF